MHTRSFPAKAGNDGYAKPLGARKQKNTIRKNGKYLQYIYSNLF